MRILRAVIVAATLLVIAAPAALAQADKNCSSFASQADAQAALRQNPSDPEGLDGPPGPAFAGLRGVACEGNPAPYDRRPVLPSPVTTATTSTGTTGQASALPHTGASALLLPAGVGLLVLGAGLLVLVRRRPA